MKSPVIVHLTDIGFRLDLYRFHYEYPASEAGTIGFRTHIDLKGAYALDTTDSGAMVSAAIERAQGKVEAIPGADIALPAFDLEAAFAAVHARLDALDYTLVSDEKRDLSTALTYASSERVAKTLGPEQAINLRAEFDRIHNQLASDFDIEAAFRRVHESLSKLQWTVEQLQRARG